jgi:hypothetical protein
VLALFIQIITLLTGDEESQCGKSQCAHTLVSSVVSYTHGLLQILQVF